jgi:hypothetical protein
MTNASPDIAGVDGTTEASELQPANVRHFDPDPRFVLLMRGFAVFLMILVMVLGWLSLIANGVLTTTVAWLHPEPGESFKIGANIALAGLGGVLALVFWFGFAPRRSDALECDADGIWPKAVGKTRGLVRWGVIASCPIWRWPPPRMKCRDGAGNFLLAIHPCLTGIGDLLMEVLERGSAASAQTRPKSQTSPFMFALVSFVLGFLLVMLYLTFHTFQLVADSILELQDGQFRLTRVLANARLRGRPEVLAWAEAGVEEAWFMVWCSAIVALGYVGFVAFFTRLLEKTPLRVVVDTEGVECLWLYGRRRYGFAEVAAVGFGDSMLTRAEPQLRLLDGREIDFFAPAVWQKGLVPSGVGLCLEIRRGLDAFRSRSVESVQTV